MKRGKGVGEEVDWKDSSRSAVYFGIWNMEFGIFIIAKG